MFERFVVGDKVLDNEEFLRDEVQYNLIPMIGSFADSLKIKSTDRNLILTQSAGHNPWVWISQKIEREQRKLLIQELVEYVKDLDFPGISAEPNTARLLADISF